VFLAYAVPGGGRALIDRELYLPQSWTGDRDRCQTAGISAGTAFQTKPELARQMVQRVIDARTPFGWFAADEAYGQNTALRHWLEDQHVDTKSDQAPHGGSRAATRSDGSIKAEA
jgi:SRSO17 transposase